MVSTPFDLDAVAANLLGETGDADLPSLTREELRGLGDDPLFANAADDLWWEQLPEAAVEPVLEAAQRGLVARNLLAGDDNGELVAVEPVRVVLAARTAPSRAVVLTDPDVTDSDGAPVQIVLLALPVESGTPDSVLVTSRIEGIYVHRLLVAEKAARVAAGWLLHADEPEPTFGRILESLRLSGSEVERERAVVVAEDGAFGFAKMHEDALGEPSPATMEAIAAWVMARIA